MLSLIEVRPSLLVAVTFTSYISGARSVIARSLLVTLSTFL